MGSHPVLVLTPAPRTVRRPEHDAMTSCPHFRRETIYAGAPTERTLCVVAHLNADGVPEVIAKPYQNLASDRDCNPAADCTHLWLPSDFIW